MTSPYAQQQLQLLQMYQQQMQQMMVSASANANSVPTVPLPVPVPVPVGMMPGPWPGHIPHLPSPHSYLPAHRHHPVMPNHHIGPHPMVWDQWDALSTSTESTFSHMMSVQSAPAQLQGPAAAAANAAISGFPSAPSQASSFARAWIHELARERERAIQMPPRMLVPMQVASPLPHSDQQPALPSGTQQDFSASPEKAVP
jgi:hypothetical protein